MKKQTFITAALVSALAPTVSSAEEAKSPYTFTGNVGLFSQYIFRGLTQTNREPAVQGGFDFSHESGFYVGNWNSNISWLTDSKVYSSSSIEMDFYGGFRNTFGLFGEDFSYDIGTLYYAYPGNINQAALGGQCCASANTWEGYFSLGWKWITFKNSFSLMSNTFGNRNSAGSWYGDLTAAFPVEDYGVTLIAHVGYQYFMGSSSVPAASGFGSLSNNELYSYGDWKVGANYDLGKLAPWLTGTTIGGFYTDTWDANEAGYGGRPSGPYPSNIADGQFVAFLQKTF
jgi:uncharacterized protein (TIGR02001 family)